MESPAEFLDAKAYIEHDPLIGYRYRKNFKAVLPRPGGGAYELVTNSQGIRSSREYSFTKPAGVQRILVFGDSYAAGQYVSNDQRFSEILERRVPNLEVINFALEGTGTDQQLLLFEQAKQKYQFDLVMLFPFLQNIRRNLVEARESFDPDTRQKILLPKPRFELVNGELVLTNVPVPNTRLAQTSANTDTNRSVTSSLKSAISRSPLLRPLKRLLYATMPWEPFPEYVHAEGEAWRLMEAIIKRFKSSAGAKPLIIIPVFYASYVRWRMARNYWTRFSSLAADSGSCVLDLLPYFKESAGDAVRCFLEPFDCHFSPQGHLTVADAVQRELVQFGFPFQS
jgi:hypothetical protein